MNPPKYQAIAYINFPIATQKAYSRREAERVQLASECPPAHDAINRLLHRHDPSSDELWQETAPYVDLRRGFLVVDDSVLDTLYAQQMDLVSRQGSGKHKRVVKGINRFCGLRCTGSTSASVGTKASQGLYAMLCGLIWLLPRLVPTV